MGGVGGGGKRDEFVRKKRGDDLEKKKTGSDEVLRVGMCTMATIHGHGHCCMSP